MRSIFGWSYPPGCSGPPEVDEGPCAVCGNALDDCICPGCAVCGEIGSSRCYFAGDDSHNMVRSAEQVASLKAAELRWEKETTAYDSGPYGEEEQVD